MQPSITSITDARHEGLLQGVPVKGASLLAWHPTRQRLVAASPAVAVEYDAVSGARRHLVEVTGAPLRLTYTPSGAAVVLLTKVCVVEVCVCG